MAFLLCGKEKMYSIQDIDKIIGSHCADSDYHNSKSFTFLMKRGQRGYGFSVTGSSPACVRRVEEGSAAWQAGLRVDDAVIRINGHNVSRSIADNVAKIVRQSEKQIILDIQRSKVNVEDQKVAPESSTTATREDENICKADFDRQSLLLLSSDECSLDLSDDMSRDLLVDLGDWSPPALRSMHSSPIEIRFDELSVDEQDRQTVIKGLLEIEQEFLDTMHFGIERYSTPLRCQFVSPSEHVTLFQNVETLISTSEYHVYKLKDTSRSYSDVTCSDDVFIDNIGAIYLPRMLAMSDTYGQYCNGIKNSFRLLAELRDYEEFNQFLQEPPLDAEQPTISGFIQKPLEHIKNFVLNLQKVLSLTPVGHQDIDNLSRVIEGFRNTCNRINESNTRRSQSMTSLVSRSSRRILSKRADSRSPGSTGSSSPGSTGSRSSDNTSSKSSDNSSSRSSYNRSSVSSGSSFGSSGSSLASSIDSEVLDVQRRLVFCEHVQTFQLATATRHMIYSGELMHVDDDDGCTELFVVLLNDLLLLTQLQADDTLLVMDYPILLHEIQETFWENLETLEFTLGVESNSNTAWLEPCDVTLRAPSLEQKLTWKNILQQRIQSSKQQHEHANVDNIV